MAAIMAFVTEDGRHPLGGSVLGWARHGQMSGGPGYTPREATAPGKALRTAFTASQVATLMRACPDMVAIMDRVGYKVGRARFWCLSVDRTLRLEFFHKNYKYILTRCLGVGGCR